MREICVPGDTAGEAVKLFGDAGKHEHTDRDLIDFCRSELTAYKVPKQVEFVAEPPKSNVGKVLRRGLRER